MDNVLDFVTFHKIRNLENRIEHLGYCKTVAQIEGTCPVDGERLNEKDIKIEIYRLEARLQMLNLSKEA